MKPYIFVKCENVINDLNKIIEELHAMPNVPWRLDHCEAQERAEWLLKELKKLDSECQSE